MTKVYLLWHVHTDDDDVDDEKLIGVYSTEEKAKDAIERLKEKPGFRDYPDGFEICDDVVDRDSWTEGFISVEQATYLKSLTQNTAVPSLVSQFTLIGDVAAASLQAVQGFTVGGGGTTLSFAAAGIGPFHSAPVITVSPADGVLTSAGASSITASSAFIQGFIGSALAAGTVNIFVSGS